MPYPELKPGYGILPDEYRHAICQIECSYGSPADGVDKRIGTGFLIARRAQSAFVVTAGHMLYHHDAGCPVRRINVAFGREGTAAFKLFKLQTAMAERCRLPQEFLDGGDAASTFDYGLFRIDDPLAGILELPMSSVPPRGSRAKLIGYPCAASSGTAPYHAIMEIEETGTEAYGYIHQTTYIGMSGGPLLGKTKTDETIRAFGLHIRGDSDLRAVRFSDAVRANLKAWAG